MTALIKTAKLWLSTVTVCSISARRDLRHSFIAHYTLNTQTGKG